MGTAMKHVLDRVKPSFVIFDIRALWLSGLSVRVPGCQKLQMLRCIYNHIVHWEYQVQLLLMFF